MHRLVVLVLVVACGCGNDVPSLVRLQGQTMGTTYSILYPGRTDYQSVIDSVLIEVNASMSTYMDDSIISMINASTDTSQAHPVDQHFVAVFEKARQVYEDTEGAFNPAVGPLVEAWGFGNQEPAELDSAAVDSLKALVDFDAFVLSGQSLRKRKAGVQLNFSAIAKGYGVDAVGLWLEEQGIRDYFVEIGGEIRTRGQHPEGRPWRTGIDRPIEDPTQREIQTVVRLNDAAMATSGNYRNFYVRDGQKYVHTINPVTGYPEINTLLSVSVIATDCMTADAYATAFMVMGLEKAKAFTQRNPQLEALFIAGNAEDAFAVEMTPGFSARVD